MVMGAVAPGAMSIGAPKSRLMPGGRLPDGWSAAIACQCTPVAPLPALALTLSVAALAALRMAFSLYWL
jgi:hypothetical protein